MTLACVAVPGPLAAREAHRHSLEGSAGYAAFIDDARIDHGTVGGAWRWQVSRRVSVGPEIVYMRGPRGDRDVFLTGKVVVDFLPRRAVSPYFVADGGVMFHRDRLLAGSYWSREAAGSFGGGVRVNATDRVYVAAEARIGWEPHVRVAGLIGFSGT